MLDGLQAGGEAAVLELMAEGHSNAAIAERLFVSQSGVEKHINTIFTKLGLAAGSGVNRRVLAVLALLAGAGVTAVFCPTTEADLGDGIGPGRELMDAGVRLAIGSDQNAVVDPLLEIRGLEAGERLRSLRRGRISPAELWRIGADQGYAALGLSSPARVGGPCDLVELDARSLRTAGSALEQLPLTATAADVRRTIVGGRVIEHDVDAVAASLEQSIDEIFLTK